MVLLQRYSRRDGDGYPLIRRPEHDIGCEIRHDQLRGVGASEHRKTGAIIDRTQIEEVRTAASRFQREVTELEHTVFDHLRDELGNVCHAASNAARCNLNKRRAPSRPSSSIAASSASPNGSRSAVPCTSMNPPDSSMTTFMSVAAEESSE